LAKFVATDFAISLNGTPLAGNIAAATINTTAAEVEITAFGNTHVQRTSGLKDASVSLDFHQDYAAGSIHQIINPLLGGYATVTIVPTSGSVSATNPSVTLSALVTEYNPIEASIGDLATFSISWPLGTGVVSYGTS
jgi:large exoprotein involved in heme utilization and adhesion